MNYFKLIVIVILTFTTYSCKEAFNLGNDTLKDDELLNATITDTVTLKLTTIKSFPLLTTGGENMSNYAPNLIIGNIIDPDFGKTYCSFFSQIRQLEYPDFGDSAILDSIFLFLPLKFGDSVYAINGAENLNLSIYKLNDTLHHYLYNNQIPEEYYNVNDLIGQGNVSIVNKSKSSSDKYDTNYLYIRLNNSFGNYLLTNAQDLFSSSNDYFYKKFFGIYVKSNNNNSGLYQIQVNNTVNLKYSGVVIYYHFPSKPNTKLDFHLPITNNSVRTNLYTHDYSNTPFISQLQDSTIVLDKAYLQSLAGTYIKISINGLKNFKNVVVHKAEILLNVDQSNTNIYKPNNYIWLVGLDSSKKFINFIDFYTTSNYTGFPYNYGTYRIIVTRIVQNIIDGKYDIDKYGLYLFDLNSNQNFNRVIINNGNNLQLRSKIVITYTKID